MIRSIFIERVRREIYGEQPSNDAAITIGLVNNLINEAVAVAAQKNYEKNQQIEGIGFVNNSFYTTFKGLAITEDERFLYKLTLPDIPVGIGKNDGISSLRLSDGSNVSFDCIPLSQSQKAYARSMRPIPNKTLYYPEGNKAFIISTLILTQYTGTVTMISAGLSTDLSSEITVPPDFYPLMESYIKSILMAERSVAKDVTNDGAET